MKRKKYIIEIKEILEKNNLISSSKINNNIEINYLSFNSKDIKDNTLFFCKGDNFTINYLTEAKKKEVIFIFQKKNIILICLT